MPPDVVDLIRGGLIRDLAARFVQSAASGQTLPVLLLTASAAAAPLPRCPRARARCRRRSVYPAPCRDVTSPSAPAPGPSAGAGPDPEAAKAVLEALLAAAEVGWSSWPCSA
eukprot:gene9640-1735_t